MYSCVTIYRIIYINIDVLRNTKSRVAARGGTHTYIYLGKYDFCTFVRFEYENIYTDLTGPPADETNLNDFIVFLVMILDRFFGYDLLGSFS